MDLSNVYLVFRIHPDSEPIHYQLVAKFLLSDSYLEVLEDHVNLFHGINDPAHMAQTISALSRSMYYKLANLKEINDGQHPELLKEHVAPPVAGPESSFKYHRVGMPQHQVLEFHQGKPYLDGHPLEDQDLQLVLSNVQAGNATLTYNDKTDQIQKAEEFFQALNKADSPFDNEMAQLRESIKAGLTDPSVLKILNHEIYNDSRIKGMGNLRSYNDFLSRPNKQGIHIRMDANDLGQINEAHGHQVGDAALHALGEQIRSALKESGGKDSKVFRIRGDEFHAFVPRLEDGALFARSVRQKLEQIPPVGGTHQLSLSIGFGHTPDHAHFAMLNAKTAKNQSGHNPGHARTHAASQVPGFEGLIPTGPDQLQLPPLPTDPMEIVQEVPHILPPDVDQSAIPPKK